MLKLREGVEGESHVEVKGRGRVMLKLREGVEGESHVEVEVSG